MVNTMSDEQERLVIKDNFQTIIKPLLDRRIHLMTQSVCGAFLGGNDPTDVSFRGVLTRIMVLTQVQIVFVLFEKEEESTDKYKVIFDFYHKTNKTKIDHEVEEINNNDNIENYLFNLFGTSYYLLCILINKTSGRYTYTPIYNTNESNVTNKNDLIAYQLRNLLSIDYYMGFGIGRHLKNLINNCLDKCKNSIRKNNSLCYEQGEYDFPFQDKFNTSLLQTKSFLYKLKGYGYLDNIYVKISKNLNHLSDFFNDSRDIKNTNYVLMIRDYTYYGSLRFELFNYNVSIALCDSQKQEIKQNFLELKKTYNSKNPDIDKAAIRNAYLENMDSYYKNTNDDDRFYYKVAEKMNEWFWEELLNDETESESIENFISIIGEKFGSNARSVADLVFDGVAHFRYPFEDGGIHRCFSKLDNLVKIFGYFDNNSKYIEFFDNQINWNSIIENKDLQRLVVTHYWYNLMSGESKSSNNKLEMVLFPIEVGGKVWCITGFFIKSYCDNDDLTIDMKCSEESWYQNYHLYHDINARLKKELRYSLEEAYYQSLSHIYTEQLKEIADIISNAERQKCSFIKVYEDRLNEKFLAITKIFPYKQVKVKIREGIGMSPNNVDSNQINSISDGVYLNENLHLNIEILPNKFFPSPFDIEVKDDLEKKQRFIKETQLMVTLSEAMRIAMVVYGKSNYTDGSEVTKNYVSKEK